VANNINVGVIGCGNISGVYLKNLCAASNLNLLACADLDPVRAEAAADQHGVSRACTPEQLLEDPDIELVVNLTVPAAHVAVSLKAIEAGKHVYSEKPLATDRISGQRLLRAAREHGVRLGCAPDTFLGAGLQTCRYLIDSGAIGQPVAATAFMIGRGPESWHPNPAIFYQAGAGPLFDMGPYYITALVHLLGPVQRVTGSTRISFAERPIASQPLAGTLIQVETATHVAALLDFASGPVASLITSFDVWAANLPRIEIYGSEGSLSVPDPNNFGGPVRLLKAGEKMWSDVELTHGFAHNARGLGVMDMAEAIRSGSPQRASSDLAFHVLDVMQSVEEASQSGRHVVPESSCRQPEPLPAGFGLAESLSG
jgi:predicted dehydrogenase